MLSNHWNQIYGLSLKIDTQIIEKLENLLVIDSIDNTYLDAKSNKLLDESINFPNLDDLDLSTISNNKLLDITESLKKERIELISLFNMVNHERKVFRSHNLKLMEKLFLIENFPNNKLDNDFAIFCNRSFNMHYELFKKLMQKEQEYSKKLENIIAKQNEELNKANIRIKNLEKTLIIKQEAFKRNILGETSDKEVLALLTSMGEEFLKNKDSIMKKLSKVVKGQGLTNKSEIELKTKGNSKTMNHIMATSPGDNEALDEDILNSINYKWQKKLMEIKEKQKNIGGSGSGGGDDGSNLSTPRDVIDNKTNESRISSYIQDSPQKSLSEAMPQILLTSPDSATKKSYLPNANTSSNNVGNSSGSKMHLNLQLIIPEDKPNDSDKIKNLKSHPTSTKGTVSTQFHKELTTNGLRKRPLNNVASSTMIGHSSTLATKGNTRNSTMANLSSSTTDIGRKTVGTHANKPSYKPNPSKIPSCNIPIVSEKRMTYKNNENHDNTAPAQTQTITSLQKIVSKNDTQVIGDPDGSKDSINMSLANPSSIQIGDFDADTKSSISKKNLSLKSSALDQLEPDNSQALSNRKSVTETSTPQSKNGKGNLIPPPINSNPVVVKKNKN